MKTCGRDKKIGIARICYRYTFGMFWLFFSRLAFITSLFLIIAGHIVLLRTKFLFTSLHIKKFFFFFLIGLLLSASVPDCAYAMREKIPIIASQVVLLLAEGSVMVRANGSAKWKDAIVGMRQREDFYKSCRF